MLLGILQDLRQSRADYVFEHRHMTRHTGTADRHILVELFGDVRDEARSFRYRGVLLAFLLPVLLEILVHGDGYYLDHYGSPQ